MAFIDEKVDIVCLNPSCENSGLHHSCTVGDLVCNYVGGSADYPLFLEVAQLQCAECGLIISVEIVK